MFKHAAWISVGTMVLLGGCSAVTPIASSSSQVSSQASRPFTTDRYAELLSAYVNEKGLVDYTNLQANRQGLDEFAAAIAAVSPETYAGWNEAEQLAFLINAYNAFTLQSIVDQTPLKNSIRDIPGVWRIRQFDIAGERKTLDNIEHQTIRVDFNEPRIHMALVCAAISCPILRDEPYTAGQLDAQLDEQVKNFLASPQGLQIDRQQNRVSVSSIFQWYGEDWIRDYGVDAGFAGNEAERAVLNFISGYLNPDDRDYLRQGGYELTYLEYDWALNQQP